jgi:hypothetical protein
MAMSFVRDTTRFSSAGSAILAKIGSTKVSFADRDHE